MKPLAIPSLTGTGGSMRYDQTEGGRHFFSGCEYKVRFTPAVIVDLTAPDHVVDDVVRVFMTVCGADGRSDDIRVVVMPLEESHKVYACPRRIV